MPDSDAVVAIAKAAGFQITIEELENAQRDLSEGELEAASGGKQDLSWLAAGSCCGTAAQKPESCTKSKLTCG